MNDAASKAYVDAETRAAMFLAKDALTVRAAEATQAALRHLLMGFRADHPLEATCQACRDRDYHQTRARMLAEAAQLCRDRAGILFAEGHDAEAHTARSLADQLTGRALGETDSVEKHRLSLAHTCGGKP